MHVSPRARGRRSASTCSTASNTRSTACWAARCTTPSSWTTCATSNASWAPAGVQADRPPAGCHPARSCPARTGFAPSLRWRSYATCCHCFRTWLLGNYDANVLSAALEQQGLVSAAGAACAAGIWPGRESRCYRRRARPPARPPTRPPGGCRTCGGTMLAGARSAWMSCLTRVCTASS